MIRIVHIGFNLFCVLAACTNHIDVISLLVNAGCEIDTPGQSGVSPVNYVKGRLKLLQRDISTKAEQVKAELRQVRQSEQVIVEPKSIELRS